MKKHLLPLLLSLLVVLPCRGKRPAATEWYSASQGFDVDVIYLVSVNVISQRDAEGRTVFNAEMDSAERAAYTKEMSYIRQSCFPDSFNFYSPYYHQVTMEGYSLPPEQFQESYDRARQDVFCAFDDYMRHYNHGHRFIIAGFSQGAQIAIDLVKHLTVKQLRQMVAAYIIGYGLSAEDIKDSNIVPATNREQTGVCISYNTVRDTSCIWSTAYNNAATCINPVNWQTDPSPATFEYEGQTLTVHIDTVRHVLVVPDYKPDQTYPFWPDGALHLQDLQFYAPFIRQNAIDRAY